MKKSVVISIQVAVFAIVGVLAIIYIMNKSPVEDLGDYEKQEMARPNKSKSIVDQFFSPSDSNDTGDDVSLTGSSGRYDEVRIGKSMEDE